MRIKDHGMFTPYVPSVEYLATFNVSPDEVADPEKKNKGFMYAKSETGQDFYEMEREGVFAKGSTLASVDGNGRIIGLSTVGDGIVPHPQHSRLYELQGDDVPKRFEDIAGKMIDVTFGRLIDPPPPLRTFLHKTEIYERMSDAELEEFDTAIRAAPLRTRRMWDDCQQIEVVSPLFATLRHDMEEAFGIARADAILSLEAIPVAMK